jgi:hypothetical protein
VFFFSRLIVFMSIDGWRIKYKTLSLHSAATCTTSVEDDFSLCKCKLYDSHTYISVAVAKWYLAFSLRIREFVSPSPTRDVKIGSDCSFAKSAAFSGENHGCFGRRPSVPAGVARIKEPSLLKAIRAKRMPKFAALLFHR